MYLYIKLTTEFKKLVSLSQNQPIFRYDVINQKFGQIWGTLDNHLILDLRVFEKNTSIHILCEMSQGIRKN